jgi:hypothetical protein
MHIELLLWTFDSDDQSHPRDNWQFAVGMGRDPGEETVPKPKSDEVVVFEEFFTTGLRMSPHPVLLDILVNFQMWLHQLTPNTIIQFSKYI